MNPTILAMQARHLAPYDVDAPITDALSRLSYVDFEGLSDAFTGEWTSQSRAQLRYLAALFPDHTRQELAETICYVVGNPSLTLRDVRTILDGRSLLDPSRHTREVPVEAIQTAGRILARGGSRASAAAGARISVETVEAIDTFLGLGQVAEDRKLDAAVDAAREGWSVRKLASHLRCPKTTAHRYLRRAHLILAELGEVPA